MNSKRLHSTYLKTVLAFGIAATCLCTSPAFASGNSIDELKPMQNIEDFSMSSSNTVTDYTPEKAARDLTNTKGLIYLEKKGLHPMNIIPLGGKDDFYINLFENENLSGTSTLYALKSEIGKKAEDRVEKKVYTVEGDILVRNTVEQQNLITPFYRKMVQFRPNTEDVKTLDETKWYPTSMNMENKSSILRHMISPNVKNIEESAILRYKDYKKALTAYEKTLNLLKEKNSELNSFSIENYHMAQTLGETETMAFYFFKDSLTFENIGKKIERSVVYLVYDKTEDRAYAVRTIITMSKSEFIRQCADSQVMPDQMTLDSIISIGRNMLPTLDYSIDSISKTKHSALDLYIPMEYKK